MSTPTRKPLISDGEINGPPTVEIIGGVVVESWYNKMHPLRVRNLYEAHLAERDALIQRVVDYWDKWQGKGCIEADMEFDDIVTDMNKAGFKSTSSSDELRNPE